MFKRLWTETLKIRVKSSMQKFEKLSKADQEDCNRSGFSRETTWQKIRKKTRNKEKQRLCCCSLTLCKVLTHWSVKIKVYWWPKKPVGILPPLELL